MDDTTWVAPDMPGELAEHMTSERRTLWRAFLATSKADALAEQRHQAACQAHAPASRVMALETRRQAAWRQLEAATRALWRDVPRASREGA